MSFDLMDTSVVHELISFELTDTSVGYKLILFDLTDTSVVCEMKPFDPAIKPVGYGRARLDFILKELKHHESRPLHPLLC